MKKIILSLAIILGFIITTHAQEPVSTNMDVDNTKSTEVVKESCKTKKDCKTADAKACKSEVKAEKSCKTSKKSCCPKDKASAAAESTEGDEMTQNMDKKSCKTAKKECPNKQTTCKAKTDNGNSSM